MNTKKIFLIEKLTFVYLPIFSFIIVCILFFIPLQSKAAGGGMSCTNDTGAALRLPFDGVWRITQGYNCAGTNCSHVLEPSGFDLRYALDFGELNYNTANQPVFAPGDGLVIRGGGSARNYTEIICINLDGLGSVEIGHFETRGSETYSIPAVGTRVSRGDIIGQLLGSGSAISTAAHIHIGYYNNDGCSHATVPFDDLFGVPLFNDGSFNLYGPQYNGFTTQYQEIGCGVSPNPAAHLPGSNVLSNAFYNSYIYVPFDAYVSQYNINLDTSTITTVESPIVDDSINAVLVRLVKEGVKYGPWLLALMIVATGFMFITSMGITTRI
ncbi:MAG: hypothetical protein KAS07_04910, partial [Candidatus Pacebacteria bacterium]|nr:hypothetical protein [Candidatus Paceibacterota bacterium]